MPTCRKCHTECGDSEEYCQACGAPLDENEYELYKKDVSENRIPAILSYVGIFVFIPILAARDSQFSRFHANQGLVLFLCELLIAALSFGLSRIPGYGLLLSLCIGLPLWIVTAVFMVMGILSVNNGRYMELPLIGRFSILEM